MNTAKTMSIKLDADIRERIEHLADSRRRTKHWLMREAIEQYVEREEKREAFKLEAIQSWENYQATGMHVTGDEVDAWLMSWGTENELPAPECHK